MLLGSTAANAAADDLDTVMHALAQREQGTASFVEQHFIALLKRPVESSGTLFYQAPDTLEKRTLKPQSRKPAAQRRRTHRAAGPPHSRARSQGLPWDRALCLGPCAPRWRAIARVSNVYYQVKFAGTAASWSLDLVPADPAMMKTVAEVRIDGVRDVLTQVEIRTADGDRSVMTLTADSKAP